MAGSYNLMNKLSNCVLFSASCFVKNNENILRIISIDYERLPIMTQLIFVVETDLHPYYKDPTKYNIFYIVENNNKIIKVRLCNSTYIFHIMSQPLSFLEFDEDYKNYESTTVNPLVDLMNKL